MEGLAAERRKAPVFLGVDTHSDAHVGVVVDGTGRRLGALTVPNSEAGYVELVGWVFGFGALVAAGVEGTGSYGAGLSRFLRARGASVLEVNRTSRQHRRRHGKHDAADAEAASRAVMAITASGEPKGADGAAESLRALRVAQRSAVKARTQAANQLHALVSTAPGELREVLSGGFRRSTSPGRRRASDAGRGRPIPPRPLSSPCGPWHAATARFPRRSPSSTPGSSVWRGRQHRRWSRSTAWGRTRRRRC